MRTDPGEARAVALAGALALCVACAGAGAPAAATPAAAATGPLAYQVLDVRDAALNARDLDGAARAYAPGAVVIDADLGAVVLRGREEIRAAHARFLAACPRARVEVLDRSYAEQGRIVADVERVRCDWAAPVEGWVRYEISGGAIVGVLKRRSPPFGG